MKKEILSDTRARPEFSRFMANLANGSSLPIFPLTFPEGDKVGVILVGDYVAQDLINYFKIQDSKNRSRWFIVGTTQSDAIPVDCADVDFNFFTNERGVDKYLSSLARKVSFSTKLGDGHYVDPKIFYPNPEIQKTWDIVYPAKWYPTKRIELLLEAAKLDPSLKVAIYGWPVVSERKILQSISYRDYIMDLAKEIPNVDIFDAGFEEGEMSHYNPDGTVVIGNLTKEEMRNKYYWKARASIFLSETTEAINRVCTEMICCDVPMLVAPTDGGLEKIVNEKTGVFINRTPKGILKGIHYVLEHQNQFNPRLEFLKTYGKDNANKKLREIIKAVARQKGVEVNWRDMRDYGGDLWTSAEIYTKILVDK